MSTLHVCSFDHQIAPTNVGGGGATSALVNRKYWDSVGGTPPTVDTTTFLHGSASMKFAAAAAGASFLRHVIGGSTAGVGAWVRRGTGSPSSTTVFLQLLGAVNNADVRLSSDGVLYLTGGAIDGSEVALFSPAASQWYWVSLHADFSANPITMSASVWTSTGQVVVSAKTRSVAVAADTFANAQVGTSAAGHGFDLNVDSYVVTDTAAAITPRQVVLLTPSNGTHSFTANDFQNQASTNLTTASDIAALVDDYPPSLSDFVKQVVIRSTGYAEFTFSDMPASGIGEAVFVQLGIANHPVGTANANTSIMRLVDGATVTAEALADMTATADTLEYHKHGYSTAPSTSGAWSTSLVNALKARWGFSDDVTPPPALDSIWLEASAPLTLTPTGVGAQII